MIASTCASARGRAQMVLGFLVINIVAVAEDVRWSRFIVHGFRSCGPDNTNLEALASRIGHLLCDFITRSLRTTTLLSRLALNDRNGSQSHRLLGNARLVARVHYRSDVFVRLGRLLHDQLRAGNPDGNTLGF